MRPVDNPRHRFERQYVEWLEEPPPAQLQVYEETATKEIVAENDSPDVGFRYSVNPYRGCTHACSYCMAGDAPILMADGRTKRLADVRVGDAIIGTRKAGTYRRCVETQVLDAWSVVKPAHRVILEDGRTFITSADHRFLTRRGWKHVRPAEGPARPHLSPNDRLMGIGAGFVEGPVDSLAYRRGWLCGMVRGDGLVGSYDYPGRPGGGSRQHHFRLALIDLQGLQRAQGYLRDEGIETREVPFSAGGGARSPMRAIRTHARRNVEAIRDIIAWPDVACDDWWKGFLGGIFDAEGSCDGHAIRIANTCDAIIDRTVMGLARFGFDHVVETPRRPLGRALRCVRVRGGLAERVRFFQLVGPAITRKSSLRGGAVKARGVGVRAIEDLGLALPLHDITTGTGDFVANGVISHNCYARPSHEYLGFGAGTDFETRIVAKLHAPELLRRKLASKSWKFETIAFSGDTDCYQPIEARYELTRRCLEACRDVANPVTLVTKSFLISRDVALIAELARRAPVSVSFSVAFDDPDLARGVEPGAPRPAKRLEAMRILADAGVRCGVLVAPIIPGLNEQEIPAVLEKAKAAGAQYAHPILVRLPHSVKEVFLERMATEFPDRARRIEARIREVRGGALTDPRFHDRFKGHGVYWQAMESMFRVHAARAGFGATETSAKDAPPAREGRAFEQLGLF